MTRRDDDSGLTSSGRAGRGAGAAADPSLDVPTEARDDARAKGPQLLDEELSALIDGELPSQRARELRETVTRDPVLRDRLNELSEVDDALRAIPAPAVPDDLLARVRDRIEQQEDLVEAQAGGPREADISEIAEGAEVVELTASRVRFARWGAPLAALAAALAVLFWLSARPDASPPELARTDPVDEALDQVSDDELALALEFELLEDLDVIRELELLEALASRDAQMLDPS